MTIETPPPVQHYIPAPVTKEELDYADLAILDLSKASTVEGRAELATLARDALHKIGFFYVINHGLSTSERERIFDVADVPFSQVPEEEKDGFRAKIIEEGNYHGYKPRQFWHVNGGVRDEIEAYGVQRDITKKPHPQALQPFLPEIAQFMRYNHGILHTILRLLARGLELPEDTFVKWHQWNAENETYLRFMKYWPRPKEDEEKAKGVWLKGHADKGSITMLWSQPVSALQIRSPDGQWKWIRHIENALIVNAGDSMEFISGGYYKATIHRVFQPPEDQRAYTRLGVNYFASFDENVKLLPVSGSPVLDRVGICRRFADEDAPTVEQLRKARTASYGNTPLKQSDVNGVEVEVVCGVVVKHYN